MDYHEIIKKLIGNINPIGETNVDNERFENLQQLTQLADNLIMDIEDMAFRNRNAHEFSIKRAVTHANDFINDIRNKQHA